MKFTRRHFLQMLGAAGAALLVAPDKVLEGASTELAEREMTIGLSMFVPRLNSWVSVGDLIDICQIRSDPCYINFQSFEDPLPVYRAATRRLHEIVVRLVGFPSLLVSERFEIGESAKFRWKFGDHPVIEFDAFIQSIEYHTFRERIGETKLGLMVESVRWT